jgi:Flp pilus assembly protein TadG
LSRPSHFHRQRGSGVFSTTSGLALFLLLLLFAVQAIVGLYTRSLVTGSAYDAARTVAGYTSSGDRDSARVAATAEFRRRLGAFGNDGARLEWLTPDDPDVVRVRVVARHPTLLPAAMTGALGLGITDRVIEVRVERFQ